MSDYKNPYLKGSRHLDGLILACVVVLALCVLYLFRS